MKKIVLIVLLAAIYSACVTKHKKENDADKAFTLKIEMMDADRAFSALSEQKGIRNAFFEFIDSNGVLLRPGTLPLAGGDAMDFITQSNDSDFVMTWEPKDATLAASGELGYTYGIYSLKPRAKDTVIYGSYVTIWKKQPGGKWKFVLQSGNEGVE